MSNTKSHPDVLNGVAFELPIFPLGFNFNLAIVFGWELAVIYSAPILENLFIYDLVVVSIEFLSGDVVLSEVGFYFIPIFYRRIVTVRIIICFLNKNLFD